MDLFVRPIDMDVECKLLRLKLCTGVFVPSLDQLNQ